MHLGSHLFALAVSLVAQDPMPSIAPVAFELHPIEQKLIDATNEERASRGLAKLEMDPELMRTARSHTAWMTRHHALQHTSRPVAENIAMGQNSVAEAVNSWMNSSGHRANMLGFHTRIGVAAYTADNGTIYWCQQFDG